MFIQPSRLYTLPPCRPLSSPPPFLPQPPQMPGKAIKDGDMEQESVKANTLMSITSGAHLSLYSVCSPCIFQANTIACANTCNHFFSLPLSLCPSLLFLCPLLPSALFLLPPPPPSPTLSSFQFVSLPSFLFLSLPSFPSVSCLSFSVPPSHPLFPSLSLPPSLLPLKRMNTGHRGRAKECGTIAVSESAKFSRAGPPLTLAGRCCEKDTHGYVQEAWVKGYEDLGCHVCLELEFACVHACMRAHVHTHLP